MTDNVMSELKGFGVNVDIKFEHWLNLVVKLGEEVNTVPLFLAKRCSWFRLNVENELLLVLEIIIKNPKTILEIKKDTQTIFIPLTIGNSDAKLTNAVQ